MFLQNLARTHELSRLDPLLWICLSFDLLISNAILEPIHGEWPHLILHILTTIFVPFKHLLFHLLHSFALRHSAHLLHEQTGWFHIVVFIDRVYKVLDFSNFILRILDSDVVEHTHVFRFTGLWYLPRRNGLSQVGVRVLWLTVHHMFVGQQIWVLLAQNRMWRSSLFSLATPRTQTHTFLVLLFPLSAFSTPIYLVSPSEFALKRVLLLQF